MSIIIKGLDMPKECNRCVCFRLEDVPQPWESDEPFQVYPYCVLLEREVPFKERDHDCPLIEIPKGHGRLIDWDSFNSKLEIQYAEGRGKALAPTILEAEE